ncbi:MAG: thiamine diphosphokinase [Desulfotignum sp.]|nr:thiamine diphosphokinase [Desulfobacteraceae bacterium]
MKCIIIAGGTLDIDRKMEWKQHVADLLASADLIIAADGGAGHLLQLGCLPHIIMGDLDSIAPKALQFFQKKGINIQPYPVRKNRTDTELCMVHALDQGADDITFVAATGTRLDHTLANIFLLARLADSSIRARIIDAHNEIYLIRDRLILAGKPGDLISLIPVSDRVEGVIVQGLAYPLDGQTLAMGSSLGVSNYFTQKKAVISIRSGTLIAAKSVD